MPTTMCNRTNVHLDDFRRNGLTHRELEDRGWEVESGLAVELSERTTLTLPQARLLIAAVRSKLPVVLSWKTNLGGGASETSTTAVVCDYIFAPWTTEYNPSLPGQLRVQYWGFAHDVYLDQIVAAETPEYKFS